MSPQMPHGPLSKHAAPRLRAALCRVQSTITWLFTHSHDTSPLISGLPCVEDTLSFTWYQPHISGCRVFGRHWSFIHTIPAPHQRLPCVEDTLSLIQGDMEPLLQSLTHSPVVKRPLPQSGSESYYETARKSEESPDTPAQKSARRRGVTWCPCVEKCAKARSHLMPLRGKAREGGESPDTPAQKIARRRLVTWFPCAEKRAKAGSHLMPLHRKAREGEESPDAPARTLSAFKFSLDYYVSCSRPYEVVFN